MYEVGLLNFILRKETLEPKTIKLLVTHELYIKELNLHSINCRLNIFSAWIFIHLRKQLVGLGRLDLTRSC
jgi:hypothetical protein